MYLNITNSGKDNIQHITKTWVPVIMVNKNMGPLKTFEKQRSNVYRLVILGFYNNTK